MIGRYLLFSLLLIPYASHSQISNSLPDDLPTETILFLKFDSVKLTERKNHDARYFNKWSKHNAKVHKANETLRDLAKMYPYKYKIISMTDTASYRKHGAKYLLWLDSFDMFTSFGSYQGEMHYTGGAGGSLYTSSTPTVEFAIHDLTSKKLYVVDQRVKVLNTYFYDRYMDTFYRKIEKQFKIQVK